MVTHVDRNGMGGCRLANVMWQIGHTISYARKYNMDYLFPRDAYSNYFPSLRIGQYNGCQIYEEEYINGSPYYQETPFMENVKLKGYWQSYKYIEPVIEELRDLFLISDDIIHNVCSIHIRRGDYGSLSFPTISLDYIRLATTYIYQKTKIGDFIIYSDDLNWCRNNINTTIFNEYNFSYSGGLSDIEDLRHMARCEHNIICNSSYSLIASELNRNPNKVVVSPHYTQWFGNGQIFHQINPIFNQIKI